MLLPYRRGLLREDHLCILLYSYHHTANRVLPHIRLQLALGLLRAIRACTDMAALKPHTIAQFGTFSSSIPSYTSSHWEESARQDELLTCVWIRNKISYQLRQHRIQADHCCVADARNWDSCSWGALKGRTPAETKRAWDCGWANSATAETHGEQIRYYCL